MDDDKLVEKIKKLPPDFQQEVNDFILEKKINILPSEKRNREPGQLKEKAWMSPDFDAPLEELKDDM